MNIFTQHNPTKLYFGKGQISQLSAEVRQMKVLLVYGGGSIKQNGVYEDVINELEKVEATIFELLVLNKIHV